MNAFDKIIECEKTIISTLDSIAQPTVLEHEYSWTNLVWSNENFRRAHLDSIDARDTKGLYMMHLCIFPHEHNTGPIYGFDIICGKSKVTGVFHDYSKSSDPNHPMMQQFSHSGAQHSWIKPRELPEWAREIFSPSMVAVSNVNTELEIDTVLTLVLDNLSFFCSEIGKYNNAATENQLPYHNRYCHYQKLNPHTPRVMAALGLDSQAVHRFIHEELFPEVLI
jgi:hypothetical protein